MGPGGNSRRSGTWGIAPAVLIMVLGMAVNAAQAQDYGARLGTVTRGGRVSFEPTGPGVLFDALDPVVRKWYVPQELYTEYQWRQWEYSNYARDAYQRYVRTAIEGNYFYDVYGNLVTKGWLIYDWREEMPRAFGSSLAESGYFVGWFNNLVIASDHKGQHHYAVTVGNQIRTTLTPMTFSKPKFNGLQWDYASDKYAATLLFSRVSAPDPEAVVMGDRGSDTRTDVTNFIGGRGQIQIGDFVKVGGTLASAYQVNTLTGSFDGDMLKGKLSGPQNFGHLTVIEVRISDDSPEDGDGGGALFASDLLIYDLEGNQTRASEIGFRPQIEGGFQRQGYLAADGDETILLRFDLGHPSYTGPDATEIERVTVELVVANDYLIEMSSDRQLSRLDEPVFTVVARAGGNVMDSSNQRVLSFDYGLPTANQILGFTLELTDLAGFRAYGEYDINRRYRLYPNAGLNQHHATCDRSDVWLLNVSRRSYPYYAFGEAFSVAPRYATNIVLLSAEGEPWYDSPYHQFEFVEDNDDQDQYPDWNRRGFGDQDKEVFPGWDENNDFRSDFNRNDSEYSPNLVPDYEEPFLRFDVDRPEYLYGVDMNHNQWIDRFENDEEADLPYRRDREGYNLYGGVHLGPDARLSLGRQDIRQIARDRRNRATYLLMTVDTHLGRWGRVRLFQDTRKVRDTIVDDLLQWVQEPGSRGAQRLVSDTRPAQDTWVHTTWAGWDHDPIPGLKLSSKLRWQLYRQRGSDDEVELRKMRRQSSFLGWIQKASLQLNLG